MRYAISFIFLLLSLQFVQAQQKQIDSLQGKLRLARTVRTKIDLDYAIAKLYIDKPDSALFYADKGLRLAKAGGDQRGILLGKYALGYIYAYQGNYPAAIQNALEGSRISSELNLPGQILYGYTELAGIYDDQRDDRRSVFYIQQAISIARREKDEKTLVTLYNTISYFYNRLNQPQMALNYDSQANELAERLHDDHLSGRTYGSMGKTYLQLKKPDIALPFVQKAIALLKRTGDHSWLHNCYTYLSDYYIASAQAGPALYFTQKELAEAQVVGYNFGILDATKKLAELFNGRDPVKAAQYYQKALALNEQLFNTEKTRTFESLAAADEQRRREETEQKKLAEEERKEDLQLIAIALFIPVFVIAVFFLSKTRLHRRLIDFMGVLSLLLAFEFITLLVHPLIEKLTGHTPVWELLILVSIAAVLVPLHHSSLHWLKEKLSPRALHRSLTVAPSLNEGS